MASLITVRLDKGNSPNLGFRLQGGKDFGTPLVIQKVNGGSPAERSGLIAGDSVIKINNTDVFNLRHKDAQDVIVRAGPSFEITVQRGGSTWKPSVTPIGSSFPSPTLSSSRNISPVTKTSLAANKKENIGAIGTGHNLSAKPFSSQVNGVNGCGRLVNNQYNSPLKLYSEQSIAETLSAQAEVLPTGALGVNFKKNEKNYDATNSAVYRMLQEAENETTSPETVIRSDICTTTNNHAINSHQAVTTSRSYTCLDEQNRSTDYPIDPNSSPLNQEGATICTDCERVIVGVFVRIKDKNLHIECFKCATCGTSLKNVGYYNINNKLYCDVHAKLAARNNPPAPNLVPITVPPGGKIPANSISAALASHSLPSPSPTSPKFAAPYQTNNNLSGPKPFSSVHAPLSPTYNTLPKTSPTTYSPASSAGKFPSVKPTGSLFKERSLNIIWPPSQEEPELPTACPLYFPPPSKVEKTIRNKKSEDINSLQEEDEEEEELQQINYMQEDSPNMSYSYEEFYNISGRKSSTECIENISETLETQKLVENVLYTRPHLKSVYQDAQIQETKEETHSSLSLESCEMKRPTDFTPNTKETFSKTKQTSTIENSVPHKWESQMLQALKLCDDKKTDVFSQIPTKFSATPLATALSTAPSQPFSSKNISSKSIPLPEETVPYFPPEHPIIIKDDDLQNKNNKGEFKRPYQKKKNDPTSEFLKDLPKPTCKLTMRDALTIASDQPYSPIQFESIKVEENLEETNKRESKMVQYKDLQKPLKPKILPESFTKFSKQEPKECTYSINKVLETIRTEEKQSEEKSDIKETTTIEKQTCQKSTTPSFQIITEEQTNTGMYPLFKGFSCSFGNKTDHSEFKIEISTTPPILNEVNQPSVKITQLDSEENEIISKETTTIEKQELKKKSEEMKSKCVEKQAEEIIYKKPLPLTSTLHKAESLPQYQVNISENAEADLKLIQKVEMAQKVHEQQKMTNTKTKEKIVESIKKPNTPLCDRPPSTTFSPRPRSITPSMINKPPPAIPYYQASLVLQPCNPVSANLLDPTSPNVSRSPSPAPSIERRHSPFPASGVSSIRPKSPAVGPPPNPLRAPNGIPTPRDFKVDEAKRSLTNYLPQYKNKRDLIEREENLEVAEFQDSLISKNISSSENLCNFQQESTCMEINKKECEQIRGSQIICEKLGKQDILTINSQKAHEEQLKQSELKSVEFQEGGRVEIQKKKTVTEEFDQIHKSKVIQIEKNVSSKQAHSFSNVKNPQIEKNQGVVGMHVTNPQPIQSCFLKSENSQCQSACNLKSKTCAKLQQQIKADQQLKCNSYPETGTSSMTDSQPFYQSQKSIPVRHVSAPGSSQKPNVNKSNIPVPNSGSTGGRQTGAVGVAPKRGRGVLNAASVGGTRIPLCGQCHSQIRGPFITALGKIWCPEHFICATPSCRRPLQDLGFVEEQGQLYCEYCFEQYLAPSCSKCGAKIKGDCLKAIGKNFHPECFNCVYCGKLFGNNAFFLEDGNPYCENDWNELFTTKCFACGFPVEAGDRWVEALNNNYHSQCFNCTMCKKNLEGQSFFAKGGRPYCKNHAR